MAVTAPAAPERVEITDRDLREKTSRVGQGSFFEPDIAIYGR